MKAPAEGQRKEVVVAVLTPGAPVTQEATLPHPLG
jgi:hypothetical protein